MPANEGDDLERQIDEILLKHEENRFAFGDINNRKYTRRALQQLIHAREDEDNLAMLTWLMDEKSERMYKQSDGEAELKDGRWQCNVALFAVDAGKIETVRRELIARLQSQLKENKEKEQ